MKTVSKSASRLSLLAVLLAAGARAESLWPSATTSAQSSMFADRKASRRGDILTIVIAESAVASSSQSTKSSRDSTIDDAISRFVYSGLGKVRGELPSTLAGGKSSYSGGGDISNSQSISASRGEPT